MRCCWMRRCDWRIFHLAGVNRPQKEEEFHIGKIIEYQVRGEDYRVLDIPPGYTHSIENIGRVGLVTLLWAS